MATLLLQLRHGLLFPFFPSSTADQELAHLCNSLPDSIDIQRVEEMLSALGQEPECNEYFEIIADVL
jgi:translation initiation factor 6